MLQNIFGTTDSQKQDEGNEQLVGREEMEERVRGMEIKTGEESKPKTPMSLLRFFLSVIDTGFNLDLTVNCKVGHRCLLLIFPS